MKAANAGLGALALVWALGIATPFAAHGAPAGQKPAAGGEEMDWQSWVQQLQESADKVRDLRRINAKMDDEVSAMRSRRYPRGEEKQRLLDAQGRARDDLAEAEALHTDLLEQARQADVPPGLLQDYEEVAELPAADE